jgi:hypothetical protein
MMKTFGLLLWTHFEEGQHDGKSSLVGDDSDCGDLIGGTHIQEQMSIDVFVPKLGPSKSNSFTPTIQLSSIM